MGVRERVKAEGDTAGPAVLLNPPARILSDRGSLISKQLGDRLPPSTTIGIGRPWGLTQEALGSMPR